jgi:hypothetical protein
MMLHVDLGGRMRKFGYLIPKSSRNLSADLNLASYCAAVMRLVPDWSGTGMCGAWMRRPALGGEMRHGLAIVALAIEDWVSLLMESDSRRAWYA